ncbi:MAG: alpha/beta hydrolase [Verrucomicrobiales bacterium]|nr:alpha/beta hydrolase [Verrucomicrobiales bacterium]
MKILLTGLMLLISAGAGAVELKATHEVAYAKYGERELLLDWFRPDDDKIYPGVIVVHGGGWLGGTRKAFETMSREIAAAGYVVANLDYRLATEAEFPGAVLDTKAAIRWMRANAETLALDREWIGAVGGSAGGHLVAMAASTGNNEAFSKEGNHSDQSDALQATVIFGAGVDQVTRVKESKSGSIKNCVIFFGGEYSEVPEVYAQGSPITHVSETTSPILMIDGEFDSPGTRYGDYRKKLDEAGVRNEFLMIPGAKHGQWGRNDFRPKYVEAILAFFASVSGS